MLIAINESGKRCGPRRMLHKEIDVFCPCCKTKVIANCGKVRKWHFRHSNKKECDTWAEKTMTDWHIDWQQRFPEEQQEIVMGNHRADVVSTNGVVIEFQHSYLSLEDIKERENFYQNMLWVIDAIEASESGNLVSESKTLIENDCLTFYWKGEKYPKQFIYDDHAMCPVLLDIGDGYMIIVEKIKNNRKKNNELGDCFVGKYISYQAFVDIATTLEKENILQYFGNDIWRLYHQKQKEQSVALEKYYKKLALEEEKQSVALRKYYKKIELEKKAFTLIKEIHYYKKNDLHIIHLWNAIEKLIDIILLIENSHCLNDYKSYYNEKINIWLKQIREKIVSGVDKTWVSLNTRVIYFNLPSYNYYLTIVRLIEKLQTTNNQEIAKQKAEQEKIEREIAKQKAEQEKIEREKIKQQNNATRVILYYEQIVDTSKMPSHVKEKYLSLQNEAQKNKWANTWVVWQCVKLFGEHFQKEYVHEITYPCQASLLASGTPMK